MANSTHPTLKDLVEPLLHSILENIVHDVTVTAHHQHRQLLASLNSTTKLPHCERCNLPRLLDPPLSAKVRGASSDPPSSTTYCDRRPWARRLGHDIYDNPFLKSDITGRPPTKKEREAAKNARAAQENGTPASEEGKDGTNPPSPSQNGGDEDGKGAGAGGQKLEKGEKKASKIDEKLKKGEYVPWHTCPSCKRSLLITRFAKHLEQCMGLSGRAASRNAMAKMNGSTPSVSRGSTPVPGAGQEGKDGEDDEAEDLAVKGPGGVRKKLLKKGMERKIKKNDVQRGADGKLPKSLAAKRPPANSRASPAPSSNAGDKRERDEADEDDADDLQVKKRQKLQRVGSTASIGSQSTTLGVGSMPEMERAESQDGSFVDDGSAAED